MPLNVQQAHVLLQAFKFDQLFTQILDWSKPKTRKAIALKLHNQSYRYRILAQLAKATVLEIEAVGPEIPIRKARAEIYQAIAAQFPDPLLIFVNTPRTHSLWVWAKQNHPGFVLHREIYIQGQPDELFLGKLSRLQINPENIPENCTPELTLDQRFRPNAGVNRITRQFYSEYETQHQNLIAHIKGITDETDRQCYASAILIRLVFVYLLQRHGFLDNGDEWYLQNKLGQSQHRGPDRFFQDFLQVLFRQGLALPEIERPTPLRKLIGQVKYLNGGLFQSHPLEQRYAQIAIADHPFEQIFEWFGEYTWHLSEEPSGYSNEINLAVLTQVFERYVNAKTAGAYHTPVEIAEYLCDRTLEPFILNRLNALSPKAFDYLEDCLIQLDTSGCEQLVNEILPQLSLLDPACGSGRFLKMALLRLMKIYSVVLGILQLSEGEPSTEGLTHQQTEPLFSSQSIKTRIITDNLYGVDQLAEATEMAKLQLFLALVASAQTAADLEPLPSVDFNIMTGNALIGLIRVDEEGFDQIKPKQKNKRNRKKTETTARQGNLLQPLAAESYRTIVAEKNISIEHYKTQAYLLAEVEDIPQYAQADLLRDHIDELNHQAQSKLNQLLLDEFSQKLGIQYRQAQPSGKTIKRLLNIEDIEALQPFHWGYHFHSIIQKKGGFDVIITNPPWNVLKPHLKEFISQLGDRLKQPGLNPQSLQDSIKKLIQQDTNMAESWLSYRSQFSYIKDYYRTAEHYSNQQAIAADKKTQTHFRLDRLFLERCFTLLRSDGFCGLMTPFEILADSSAQPLRNMLLQATRLDTVLGFSNSQSILENLSRRFKFCLMSFAKGGNTDALEMTLRIEPEEAIAPAELEDFLHLFKQD